MKPGRRGAGRDNMGELIRSKWRKRGATGEKEEEVEKKRRKGMMKGREGGERRRTIFQQVKSDWVVGSTVYVT